LFKPNIGDQAWMATYKAALFKKDYTTWLCDQFKDNEDYLFSAFINMDTILPWTRANFPKPTDDSYTYFKTIEDCINYAIRYCAEAINLVTSNFVGCDCGGNSNRLPELTQTDPTTLLQENMVIQAYFTLFSLTSLSTSLYMISVATTTSKLQELLEKVFPLLYH